ncbi:MAG: archease [bacterium]|nr:archease [bacterium]
MTYKFEDHTADIMLSIKSDSLIGFFNDILAALWEIFVSKNDDFKMKRPRYFEFKLFFDNPQELVFNFINKYIYFVEVKRLIICKVKDLNIIQNTAIFVSEVIKLGKFVSYIKSPTYHNFEVDLDNYFCRVVLDV